jgi:hypothetical protein
MKRFNPRCAGSERDLRGLGVKKAQHYRHAAFAAFFAACVSTGSSASSIEAAVSSRYDVLQSFSHEFGSKFASGYFVREIDRCLVTLNIAEKNISERQPGQTAAHVRLILNPGQMAGLDSDEGQSLNLTCTANGTALILDSGEKDALIAFQKRALSNDDFAEFVIP